LNRVVGWEITTREAALVLGLSERQTWRILAAYRREGAAALAHGNRGRQPRNAIPESTRQHVLTLARTVYPGLNHTHLTDLLAEREGLTLARSTVRGIPLGAGIRIPRPRRAPRHRSRRQRMPREGMLLQLDGSPHAWLEDRGTRLTLLLSVDDATGTAPAALFRPLEDTRGYFLLLQTIVEQQGIPLAVYTDRHAVFQPLRLPSAEGGLSQFGRALREMGIQHILALSPEAKGRVERANGTFQDRLVAELRLAGARTLHEANHVLQEFLPRFNTRFGVPAAQPGSAYRPLAPELYLAGVICFKERRMVARDNTIAYQGRTLQLLPGNEGLSHAGALVEVQQRLDGILVVCSHDRVIPTQDAPGHAAMLRQSVITKVGGQYIPANLLLHPTASQGADGRRSFSPWDDYAYKSFHRKLIRAGMEHACQQGKHIGRPRIQDREGFSEQLKEVFKRMQSGELSRRKAAIELGIGYATHKRLLDTSPQSEQNMVTDKIPQH
ncbi:MAG: ISNCY family transposase, partial [Chloroflexota bacterium]